MFAITEFQVEAIIRERLEEIKSSSDIDLILEDIYGRLNTASLQAKYGAKEIQKVKDWLMRGDIHIHQALTTLASDTKLPSFSIHLQSDNEKDDLAGFSDTDGKCIVPIGEQVVVPTFTADSYDTATKTLYVPDSVDLSNVYANRYYVDGDGITYQVVGNVNDDVNHNDGKFFSIDAPEGYVVNFVGGRIISAVQERQFETKYIPSQETLMIGAHAQSALLTKYLYYLLRYILYTAKNKFHNRNLELSRHVGSDFNLNQQMLGDSVYSRFITLQVVHYDNWRGEELPVIDAINPHPGGGDNAYCYVDLIQNAINTWSYDNATGIVTVPDIVDLSETKKGHVFKHQGTSYKILGGISNQTGNKQFVIQAGLNLTLNNSDSVAVCKLFQIRSERDRLDRECGEQMTHTTTLPEE